MFSKLKILAYYYLNVPFLLYQSRIFNPPVDLNPVPRLILS